MFFGVCLSFTRGLESRDRFCVQIRNISITITRDYQISDCWRAVSSTAACGAPRRKGAAETKNLICIGVINGRVIHRYLELRLTGLRVKAHHSVAVNGEDGAVGMNHWPC